MTERQAPIDRETLAACLSYDRNTGVFTWLIPHGRWAIQIGSPAGTLDADGYVKIHLQQRFYRAHRLAWLYEYGEWPAHPIDHINRIRSDNRIDNLRLTNPSANGLNSTVPRRQNKTGFVGVVAPTKRIKHWRARITVNYKQIHLGNFDSAEAAYQAHIKAKQELGHLQDIAAAIALLEKPQ